MGAAQEEGYWKYTFGYLANTCDQLIISFQNETEDISFLGSLKITSLKDWQNLCDKVILLGHLLLRFLS